MNVIIKRKIILLSLIFIFALTFVIQSISAGKSSVKNISFSEEADSIEIVSKQETIKITKEESAYFISEKKYPAAENSAAKLFDSIKNIKVLGKATSTASDAQKYGLDEENRICVSAKNKDKLLQQIYIGKDTATGGQSYIQFAGKDAIYIAAGSLHSDYSASTESLRNKSVYSLSSANIKAVSLTSAQGTFSLQKKEAKDAGESEWELLQNEAGVKGSLDQSKVNAWISQIARLSAQKWADDNKDTQEAVLASLTITSTEKTVTVKLFKENDEYLCKSSESPYYFYLADYNAEKINKDLSDLME